MTKISTLFVPSFKYTSSTWADCTDLDGSSIVAVPVPTLAVFTFAKKKYWMMNLDSNFKNYSFIVFFQEISRIYLKNYKNRSMEV